MTTLSLYIDPSLSLSPSDPKIQSILSDIRSTSYIHEVTSGECSAKESGLWNTVYPRDVPGISGKKGSELISALKRHTQESKEYVTSDNQDEVRFDSNSFALIDQETLSNGGSVLVVQIDQDDTLRVARRSLIEVAANLSVANMSIKEYKDMCGGAEVYDAGQ
ncbi:unnamed protein product [Sympodiomycopsis kandeliae]